MPSRHQLRICEASLAIKDTGGVFGVRELANGGLGVDAVLSWLRKWRVVNGSVGIQRE